MSKKKTPDEGSPELSHARLGRGPPTGDEVRALLMTLEQQVIPRLIEAHQPTPGCVERVHATPHEVEEIARLAVAQAVRPIILRLCRMAEEGLSFRSILLQVIAPAAQWLGECWLDDALTFTEVTVGSGVLERVAVALGEDSEPPLRHGALIVLTAAPGEQHALPIHLLGELLRHEGWAVYVNARLSPHELANLLAHEYVAAVGITCKDPKHLRHVGAIIEDAREDSLNQHIAFYLGGDDRMAPFAPAIGAEFCATFDDFLEAVGRPGKNVSVSA
ncbi:MAG: hypothetical protein AAF938_06425 [Myxococcota bacterium]